ncbi:hypothetical protein VPH35_104285 [Triticum aestivum]
MDLPWLLPQDVLADVLRFIPPCSIAACRCVCKALRSTIDDHCLLCADLLPLSVAGIFINFNDLPLPEFFSRPSAPAGPSIFGRFDYLPYSGLRLIQDHCNGLLLFKDYVANPATRQWESLPSRPMFMDLDADFTYEDYLVFDPTLSPHYEVFVIPRLRYKRVMRGFHDNNSEVMEKSEWPPSLLGLHVFSSKSGCWEGRDGVYWRGDLFVLCEAEFIMRIYLSNCTYKLIKSPTDTEVCKSSRLHLGRSKKGVLLGI